MRSRYALVPFLLLAIWLTLREAKSPTTSIEKAAASPVKTKTSKPSARAPASAPGTSVPTVEDLARWISQDNLCDEEGHFRLKFDAFKAESERRMQLYSALVKAGGTPSADDDCIKAMHTENREDVLRLTAGKASDACRFLRALTLTGQWGQMEFGTPKEEESQAGLKILSDLASADSTNGIYPFFKLILLEGAEQKQAFQEFLSARRFESPLTQFYMRLRDLSLINPTASLYAIELMSTAGIPDYHRAAKAGKDLIQLPENYEDGGRWIEWLAAKMESVQSQKLYEPAIILVEFGALRTISMAYGEAVPEVLAQEGWRQFFRSGIVPFDNFVEYESVDCRKQHEKLREVHTRFSHEIDDLNKRWQDWVRR